MVINRSFKLNIVIAVMLAVMIFLPMDLNASQDDTKYSAGHFYYHSYPGYVSICGYIGDETDISIPSSISGKPVSVIESGAFNGCDSIKTIEVPDTVIKVAEDSFTGAGSLEKIVSHTVDVTINAGDDVSVDYISQVGEGSDTGVSTGDAATSSSDVLDTADDNKNDSSAASNDQGQKTTDAKQEKKTTSKNSGEKQSDIGDGSYVDGTNGLVDSDASEYKDTTKTDEVDGTEEKKKTMLISEKENGDEETVSDMVTMETTTQIDSESVSFVVVLIFALCLAIVIGVIVFFVLKKRK